MQKFNNVAFEKKDRSFSKTLSEMLAQLSFSLQQSPSLIGHTSFIILIVLEYMFLGLMIIIATFPQYYDDSKHAEKHRSQDYNNFFHMFPHEANYKTFSEVPSYMIFIIIGTFGFNICIFGISIFKIRQPTCQKVEKSFSLKLVSTWLAIHQVILTYFTAYALLASVIILTALGQNSVSSPPNEYYLILALLVIGLISYIATGFISFEIARTPLFVRSLYWNSSASLSLYLKELLKFVIILQDLYLHDNEITSSQLSHSVYMAILLLCTLTLCFYKTPNYFDSTVNQVHKISTRFIFCVSFLSFVRVAFQIGMLDLLLYCPIVFYTLLKGISIFEEKLCKQGITKYIEGKLGTAYQTKDSLQFLIQILNKLKKDAIGASNSTKSSLNDQQERTLAHLNYNHRLQCHRVSCICNHYEYICMDQFKNTSNSEEEIPNIGIKTIASSNERTINMQSTRRLMISPKASKDNFEDVITSSPFPNFHIKRNTQDQGSKQLSQQSQKHQFSWNQNGRQTNLDQNMDVDSSQKTKATCKLTKIFSAGNQFENESAINLPNINDLLQSTNIQSQLLTDLPPPDLTLRISDLFQINVQQPLSYQTEQYQKSSSLNSNRYDIDGQPKIKSFDQFKSNAEFLKSVKQANFKCQIEAKDYYFSQLIGIIVEDYYTFSQTQNSQTLSEQSTWIEYRLLYFQFQCLILNRPFYSVYNLLQMKYQRFSNSSGQDQGFLSRIKMRLCELILLNNMQSILEDQQMNCTQISDSFSVYLDMGNKLKRLDLLYDKTAIEISQFWKLWSTNDPSIDQVLQNGKKLSQNIGEVKRISSGVNSNSSILFQDNYRYNMHILFHQNLLNDPVTSNNMIDALRNYVQFKTKNKLSNNAKEGYAHSAGFGEVNPEHADSQFSENAVCLVSANNGDFRNLSIVFGNKQFLTLTGTSIELIQGMNIKAIMPQSVREVHDCFIKRFFTIGNKNFMKNPITVFVKDMNGIIRPCTFKLLFTYDPKFKYAFITQFERLHQLNLIGSESAKVPVSDCMIFLTDDKYEITEVSQGVLNYCGFKGDSKTFKNALDNKGKTFSLSQFIVNLNELLFKDQNNQIFGETKESSLQFKNKIVNVRRYNEQTDDFLDCDTFLGVLSYFEEPLPTQIEGQNAKIHVFVMVPLCKHPEADQIIQGEIGNGGTLGGTELLGNYSLNSPIGGNIEGATETLLKGNYKAAQSNVLGGDIHQSSTFGDEDKLDMSSCSSAVSSVDSGIDSAFYLKNILFQTRSPRILRMTVYIMFSLFNAFLVVNLYNLASFLVKHQQIGQRIIAYYYAAKKLVRFRMVLMNLKILHTMSYEEDILSLQNDSTTAIRLNVYRKQLYEILKLANFAMDQFNAFNVNYKTSYNFEVIFRDVVFLSAIGNTESMNMTLKHQGNLFSTYVEDFNLTQMFVERPSLNTSHYPYRNNTETTAVERHLYFIFENGIKEMNQREIQQIQKIVDFSKYEIDTSIITLNATTYVSVAIVSTIMLILVPLFMKVFSRQYSIFRYLQFLEQDQTQLIIERCNDYLIKMKQEEDYDFAKKSLNGSIKKDLKPNKTILSVGQKIKGTIVQKIKNEVEQPAEKVKQSIHENDESKQQEDQSEDVSVDNERCQKQIKKEKSTVVISINKRDYIEHQISRRGNRDKIGVLIFIAFCIGYLNSSLLVSQSFSNNVFLANTIATADMRVFFKREVCIYNILLYMRESYQQNQTIMIKIYAVDGTYKMQDSVKYYISYCMSTENMMANIYKHYPVYLNDAQSTLSDIEGPFYCNTTFDILQQQGCTTIMDGLLSNGYDAAISYIINYITQLDINFKSNPAKRTKEYLDNGLKLLRFNELIDLTMFYMRGGLMRQQNAVVASIEHYFAIQKTLYLVIFVSYISCTLLIALVFGLILFKRIKNHLLDIQNMLVLMPLSEMDQQQRYKIEQYLAK